MTVVPLDLIRDDIYSYAGIIREYRKSLDFDHVADALRKLADQLDAHTKAIASRPTSTAAAVELMAMSVAGHLVGAQALADASAADAARWHKVATIFDGMKTSTSERFLDCLGIDGDVCKSLGDLLDAKEKGPE